VRNKAVIYLERFEAKVGSTFWFEIRIQTWYCWAGKQKSSCSMTVSPAIEDSGCKNAKDQSYPLPASNVVRR
jgi:hypothetical protein